MTTRKDFDDWLAQSNWIVTDVTVSEDAMRAAPDKDDAPIKFGRFVGTVIDDE